MEYYNPVAMLKERTNQNDVDNINVNGRVTLNIKAVEGLKWDNFVSYYQEKENIEIIAVIFIRVCLA